MCLVYYTVNFTDYNVHTRTVQFFARIRMDDPRTCIPRIRMDDPLTCRQSQPYQYLVHICFEVSLRCCLQRYNVCTLWRYNSILQETTMNKEKATEEQTRDYWKLQFVLNLLPTYMVEPLNETKMSTKNYTRVYQIKRNLNSLVI